MRAEEGCGVDLMSRAYAQRMFDTSWFFSSFTLARMWSVSLPEIDSPAAWMWERVRNQRAMESVQHPKPETVSKRVRNQRAMEPWSNRQKKL